MRRIDHAIRTLVLVSILATLGGCGEYFDRREGISLGAGDAIAADKVTMMVDPWPPVSADKNIAFNGERMENAVQRYRTNTTFPPSGTGTSAAYQPVATPTNPAPSAPTPTQPAAPVKQ
jgi:hypothetical protein